MQAFEEKNVQETTKKAMRQIFIGSGVGLANSLFGGGGGMLAVPMLKKTGLEEKRAHATAILLILPVSVASFLLYVFKGNYDAQILIPTAVGVTLGGALGATLLDKLPAKSVAKLFALLQLVAGISLLFFRK